MEEKHNGVRCLTLRVAGGGRGHQEPEGEEDARGAHLCDVKLLQERDGVRRAQERMVDPAAGSFGQT